MLPMKWVEQIFNRLTVCYGRDFINRYEGADLQDVKDDWAHTLGGFVNHAEAIAYGLKNLPDGKPPTAFEFRAICRRAPAPARPAIEAPKPDRAKVAEFTSGMKQAIAAPDDMTAWARKPKSAIAFSAVLDLVREGDYRFDQILTDLREAGHVVGDRLVNRWDGFGWVAL